MSASILEQAGAIQQQLLPRLEIAKSAAATIEEAPFPVLPDRANLTELELADAQDFADLVDVHVLGKTPLVTARMVETEILLTKLAAKTTILGREAARSILQKQDDRLLVIAGPCSVHDPEEFIAYADWLKGQRERFGGDLEIDVRQYFEKPRTAMGWAGFLYDPLMNQSHDITLGIIASRLIARKTAEMGVPAATERLNITSIPVFFNGLVTYDAIGARNVTDQAARKYGSATSSVIGFKNPLDGTIEPARDAIIVANHPSYFIATDVDGDSTRVEGTGNPEAHLILRGGADGPNYSPAHIDKAVTVLREEGLLDSIVVDCSHGNSGKNPDRQMEVAVSIAEQLAKGQRAIAGAMVESYHRRGNQPVAPRRELMDGVSVTDACSSMEETEAIFEILAKGVRARRRAA